MSTDRQCFGPLLLHQKNIEPTIYKPIQPQDISCVLCEEKFTLPDCEKQLLTHLFVEHRLVIADVNQIADINEYLRYWRLRFKDNSLPYYCTTMLLDTKPDGSRSANEEYYLLSDVLPEDKELRSNLQHSKLEKILERHQFEREDNNYIKECLFCRDVLSGTRCVYLNHLYEKHNFHIAKPENLVFIDELIDTIASKIEKLRCIFCEGLFTDRNVLKEHMRKKGHKRINPENKEYDKYFMINYTGDQQQHNFRHRSRSQKSSTSKYQQRFHKPPENGSEVDSDPDWSEWTEESGPLIRCLFCKHEEAKFDNILEHMEIQHYFSFTKITQDFEFYHKIKIVNFIRRQIHLRRCLTCNMEFDEDQNLQKHLREMNHCILPKEKWDQPEYFFPTYEDDLFLCFMQDDEESSASGDEQDEEKKNRKRNSMSETISKQMALAVLNDINDE